MQLDAGNCTMPFVWQFLKGISQYIKEILPKIVKKFFIFRFVYLHCNSLTGPLWAEIEHATHQYFSYLFLILLLLELHLSF